MVQCRSCGRHLEEAANYCPYCGAAVRMSYQPMPAYVPPPKDSNTALIIIVVVVVVLVLPSVLAGLLYIMVMGTESSHPSVDLNSESPSSDKVTFIVVSVSQEIELNQVWVNLHSSVGDESMTPASFPEGSNTSKVSNGWCWLAYDDEDGDRMLSSGDTIGASSVVGSLPSGPYVLELREGYQGEVLGTCVYIVP